MKFTLCTDDKVFPYMLIDDFYDSQSGDYQIFDTSKGVLHQCNYFEDESADECETPFKN